MTRRAKQAHDVIGRAHGGDALTLRHEPQRLVCFPAATRRALIANLTFRFPICSSPPHPFMLGDDLRKRLGSRKIRDISAHHA
nr:hypothetical protein [Bradyrhizobium diazoefficiens]